MRNLLYVAFESLPFIKTGGLADVMYALPKAIDKSQYNVSVCLPLLKPIKEKYVTDMQSIGHIYVNSGNIHEEANILMYKVGEVDYVFIENDTYFWRDQPYGYDDDAARYAFFNVAVCEMMISLNYFPDIIHTNDYHTAMIPALCRTRYGWHEQIRQCKQVFSIHNMAYQGIYNRNVLFDLLGLNYSDYANGSLRMNDDANFMKAGIVYADKIGTVSETYSWEIQTPEYGEHLDEVLRMRKADVFGIVNGIDTESFDPATDQLIYKNYTKKTYKKNKLACKKSLQFELGLEDKPDTMLVGVVSRLTFQKGINLIIEELEYILQMDVQVAILGTGEEKYENVLRDFENRYPGKFVFYRGYNAALANKMYAGLDMLLMPSLFEPCGISQLIAMRYGTLPLVRETGGLKDTVKPYNRYTKEGNGFSFTNFKSYEFKNSFDIAYNCYHFDKDDWHKLITNAMDTDVSFDKSARLYEGVYEEVAYRWI